MLQGFYKVAVVDTNTGKEIWRQPEWRKNLILNNGMDAVAAHPYMTCMRLGIAGTGTRMNFITSSASSGSVINGFLYLDVKPGGIQDFSSSIYEGYSGSLQAGDMIKFEDGTEIMVTGSFSVDTVVSDLSASVNNSLLVVSTQSFTIWKTSQDRLEQEVRRAGTGITTSSYLDLYNGTIMDAPNGTVMHYRTYDFGSESISRSYTEVGVGWSVTAQSKTVFSRIRLPAPVTLSFDQRLRMVYGLFIQLSPTNSVYTSNVPISGWPVAPSTNTNVTQSIQVLNLYTWQNRIFSSGADSAVGQSNFEPFTSEGNCYFWLSANSESLFPPTGSLGSPGKINRSQSASLASSTLTPYTCGSYSRFKYATFGLNDSNSDRLYTCGLGSRHGSPLFYDPWFQACAYTMRFDQPQVKTDTQTLTLYFKYTWGRILE